MVGHSDSSVNTQNAGTTENNSRHRIYWKDIQATKGVHLEFDATPFVILGHKLLKCENGPDRNRALKEKQSISKRQKGKMENGRGGGY